ncbi:MAG: right-handed parallel beta-helix repeat-containing protein [Pseudomonadota bacterium]
MKARSLKVPNRPYRAGVLSVVGLVAALGFGAVEARAAGWSSLDQVEAAVPPGEWLHWSDPATKYPSGHPLAGQDFPDTSVWWPNEKNGFPGLKNGTGKGVKTHVIYWGSMATCPDGRIFVNGGGHAGYSGIETPAFDPRTGRWEMARENWKTPAGPEDPRLGNYRWPWPDNGASPASVHLYGGLTCDADGLLYRFGGATWSSGHATAEAWVTDTKDPNGWWRRLSMMPRPFYSSAVAVGRKIYLINNGTLYEYQPQYDTPAMVDESMARWQAWREAIGTGMAERAKQEAGPELSPEEAKKKRKARRAVQKEALRAMSAAVVGNDKPYRQITRGFKATSLTYDPKLNALIGIGKGRFYMTFLDNPGKKATVVPLVGDVPATGNGKLLIAWPALVYDPKRNAWWIWTVGSPRALWVAKLEEHDGQWRAVLTYVPNAKGPAPIQNHRAQPLKGVFGVRPVALGTNKMIYSREHDVLMAYQTVAEGWWIYRPSFDQVPPPTGVTGAAAFVRKSTGASQPNLRAAAAPSRFKDPTPRYPLDPGPAEPRLSGDLRLCGRSNHSSCDGQSIRELKRKGGSLDGKTIVLAPGHHKTLRFKKVKNLTILCEPGAWFGEPDDNPRAGGAAIKLVQGDGLRVEGCHFQNMSRGIELNDTITATIKNNSFANHNMHIQIHSAGKNPDNALGTGRIVIDDNVFFGTQGHREYAHGMYLSGGLNSSCEITNNRMLRFSDLGNGLKLGCARGLVENNEVLMLDGAGSVVLDIIKGGDWDVRNNVFQSGPNRDNSNLASLAVATRRKNGGVWNPEHHDTRFQNNTWILDGGVKKGCVMKSRSPGSITFERDRLVGFHSTCGKKTDVLGINAPWVDVSQPRSDFQKGEPLLEAAKTPGLQRFESRAQAGLKPYEQQVPPADRPQSKAVN